jgi:hypothetical protein
MIMLRVNPKNIPNPTKMTGILFNQTPIHDTATPTAISQEISIGLLNILYPVRFKYRAGICLKLVYRKVETGNNLLTGR